MVYAMVLVFAWFERVRHIQRQVGAAWRMGASRSSVLALMILCVFGWRYRYTPKHQPTRHHAITIDEFKRRARKAPDANYYRDRVLGHW